MKENNTKICKQCGIEKKIDEFYSHSNKCKKCRILIDKNRKNELIKNRRCINCSKQIEENSNILICNECSERNKIRLKTRRKELTTENRCLDCAKLLGNNDKHLCFSCREKHNRIVENRRDELIQNHQCRDCAKPIENKNKSCCNECLAKISIKNKNKFKQNIQFKIRNLISKEINVHLKNNGSSKNGESCLKYLPFTVNQLKEHLEKQFEQWMDWSNHGLYRTKIWNDDNMSTWTWQIDHITPCDALPYTSMDDENFKKCWALENLRPLSAKENLKKGNKIYG